MVLATAGMAVASEASRERDNGESFISTAFKFSILIIALLGLIVLVIGLYVFNNWAGILSIPADIVFSNLHTLIIIIAFLLLFNLIVFYHSNS